MRRNDNTFSSVDNGSVFAEKIMSPRMTRPYLEGLDLIFFPQIVNATYCQQHTFVYIYESPDCETKVLTAESLKKHLQ